MREIRVSRIKPKFIEYQWKKARPDPQSFDPNQRYRLIITYNLMYVPHYYMKGNSGFKTPIHKVL